MTIRERNLYIQVKEMWIKGFTIKFTNNEYKMVNIIKGHEVKEISLWTDKEYIKRHDLQGICDVIAMCIESGSTLEYTK